MPWSAKALELVRQQYASVDSGGGSPKEGLIGLSAGRCWRYPSARWRQQQHTDAYVEALGTVGDLVHLQEELAALAPPRTTTSANGVERRELEGPLEPDRVRRIRRAPS